MAIEFKLAITFAAIFALAAFTQKVFGLMDKDRSEWNEIEKNVKSATELVALVCILGVVGSLLSALWRLA